ncbi:hypothetical protein AWH48_12240 [Domibacillus aminovorans]|uniref:DNA-binding protein n=1 Tax=Domibacillus aminovorans TaxID=29332 RepID=A0A177KIC4_9BACI|nr:hypothetical protein [Domibacillus aminovorans]OAH53119.1 hypothetical protein AWH48_12240 [Domibacillus aminovorans]
MFKFEFDETTINVLAEKIASRAFEKLEEKLDARSKLPPMLNNKQMQEVLQISKTKATELLNRPDFPVFREAGVLIPTHRLFEWIDSNTRWVNDNTGFFKDVI